MIQVQYKDWDRAKKLGYYLHEDGWTTVNLEGSHEEIQLLQISYPGKMISVAGRAVLSLQFGNSIGIFHIPGLDFPIKVKSPKIKDEEFEILMEDLTRICTALPFSGSGSSSFGIERTEEGRYLSYHALIYLYYSLIGIHPNKVTLLSAALQQILREPHRRFETIRKRRHLAFVSEVDDKTLMMIARGNEKEIVPDYKPVPHPALQDKMPEYLDTPKRQSTVDTPDNRFVRFFLDEALHMVNRYEGVLNTMGRQSQYLRQMREKLMHVRRAGLWHEVERLTHLPVGSTVLQQHRSYREVFKVFIILHRISRFKQEWDPATGLLEVHDIGKLYEIWCYFKMFEVLQELLGREPGYEARMLEDKDGMSVRWENTQFGNTWTLSYQRRFGPGNGSTSLPFAPDIVLHRKDKQHPDAEVLHLFDAKFRVDKVPDDSEGNEVGRDDEVRVDFNRDALYKMHTYHDAIPASRTVWAIYPGTEFRYFPAAQSRGGCGGQRITSAVQFSDHYQGHAIPCGVGAIPLKPEVVEADSSTGTSSFTARLQSVLEILIAEQE